MSPSDDELNALLTDHFDHALTPQLGRAATAFHASLAAGHGGRLAGSHWLRLFAAPLAMAASVAIAVGTLYLVTHTGGGHGSSIVERDLFKEQATYVHDVDEGPVVLTSGQDGGMVPARQIRRQSVQETRWFDPQEKASMKMTVPQEHMVYVGQQPY